MTIERQAREAAEARATTLERQVREIQGQAAADAARAATNAQQLEVQLAEQRPAHFRFTCVRHVAGDRTAAFRDGHVSVETAALTRQEISN